jgi:hypothetical protein
MGQKIDGSILLDLNNPIFQKNLFDLQKNEQRSVLGTLRKISNMSWQQLYGDTGLKWEAVASRSGSNGTRLYSFRIGKGFRWLAYREGNWLRILSLHPDHDATYD